MRGTTSPGSGQRGKQSLADRSVRANHLSEYETDGATCPSTELEDTRLIDVPYTRSSPIGPQRCRL